MKGKQKLLFACSLPCIFLIIMWTVYLLFSLSNIDMGILGIRPVKIDGLPGIVTSVFAHGSLKHIISNSLSFIILSTALFYFYRTIAYKVFFINWLFSGTLLWLGGRDSTHIGASGLIYGLAFFLFFSGILRKDRSLKAISMIVVLIYGGMIWGMLPQGGHISWEGHLYGAVSGISLAWFFKNKSLTPVQIDKSSISTTYNVNFTFDYEE